MTNAELIAALRYCISDNADDCDLCPYQIDCKSNGTGKDKMIRDAADALEAADKRIAELEAQLPKEGEWKCSYPEIEPNPMFIYGICSICGFEQGISNKLNYCPNCGSVMKGGCK